MHDAFAIGIPTFAVMLGILLNRRDLTDFRSEMNRRFEEVNRRFEEVNRRFEDIDRRFEEMDGKFESVNHRLDRIDDDLKHFHNVTGNLEGRIDELSRR